MKNIFFMCLYVGEKVRDTRAKTWVKVGTLRVFDMIFFSKPNETEQQFSHIFQFYDRSHKTPLLQ